MTRKMWPLEKISTFRPNGAHQLDHAIGARSDVVRRLTVWTPVTEQIPVRACRVYLDASKTFVVAVIPFDEVAIDFRHRPEAGQVTGPRRALQRTG